jgi:RNA polymerase sigma factor (sigma-70 family)
MRQQLSRFESWLIHRKAKQLIGEYGLTPSDLADLEQDLATDLLRRLKDFDPRRAKRQTFAAKVIEHGVAAIIEHRSAARRDWRRECCSLNESLEDSDGQSLARYATIDVESGRPGTSSAERQDLAIEVRQAMARLPERLRRLAQCLMTRTPYEAIHELGIPKTTLYRDLEALRQALREAGLEGYCGGAGKE